MKPKTRLAFAFALFALPSCTTIYAKTPDGGIAVYNSLGGDSQGVTVTPNGSQLAQNNNSVAFNRAASVAGSAFAAHALAGVTKNMHHQAGLTDRAAIKGATNRAGIAAGTDQAGIAAGTEQAGIAAGTDRVISNNATAVELERIKSETELGLKALDTPLDTPLPTE